MSLYNAESFRLLTLLYELDTMFKYQSFNAYSKSNLESNRIYFNRYDYFNDPFECWCIEHNGYPDPEVDRERFLNVIKTWGFSTDRIENAFEYYTEYVEDLKDCPGIVNAKKESARIACFSAEPDNLLMWSHYADGLRGFCIELDDAAFATDSPDRPPVEVHHVAYRTSPPCIDTVAYSIANDMYWHNEDIDNAINALRELDAKVLATKPYPWAYESEIRAITHIENGSKNGVSLSYSPKMIRRIIIGEKASYSNIDFIKKVILKINPNISIEIASRLVNDYKVVLSPICKST